TRGGTWRWGVENTNGVLMTRAVLLSVMAVWWKNEFRSVKPTPWTPITLLSFFSSSFKIPG
ncbi:hypothetical protein PV939_11100, partial [Ligilactobacillus salivarius]|nr:hypothetical protein [Ligilactobacillus salivarius]